ncbi:NAC domain-containing protein 90 [Prunus yedoensis var. nudiflora]|uniref:NAC domain-containing protein 90 n=1 Tax=Prunus yedoensis var. nudiflora TaxID=2094558 RepID=A0A315B1E3_PRUYE|nr:NAC domain-containing protein 90 [Prunus yedoensis var. nudiflora]
MQLRHEFSLCRVYKKSKCLRAFDRRPLGVEIMSNPSLNLNQTAAAHEGAGHQDQGSTSHSSNPLMGSDQRRNSSSPESSSSGDHHGPQPPSQPAGETGTLPMVIDNNEALWDLEQLMINNNWL